MTFAQLYLTYTRKEQYLTLIGVVLAWMFDAADFLLLTFVIIQIGEDLAFAPTTKGWLMGLQLLGTGIGGLLFGFFGDTLGRKRTLIIVICIYSVFTVLTAFAFTIATLFVIRFLTGIGVGGVWALGSSLIGEIWPKEKRNVGISITQAGWPLGELLAGLLVVLIVPYFDLNNLIIFGLSLPGWRVTFLFGGIAVLSAVFIHFFVPESKAWKCKKEQECEERALNNINYHRLDFSVFTELFSRKLRKVFLMGLGFGIAGMMTFYAINSWLPGLFQIHPHEQDSFFVKAVLGIYPHLINEPQTLALVSSALMIGVFWGTSGYIGHVLFGFFSNWFGRRPTFIGYSAMILASAIILGLFVEYEWAKYVGLTLFTFGCGYFSSFGAVFSEIYPTKVRATAASLSYNGARGFTLLAPVMVEWAGILLGDIKYGILIGGFFILISIVLLYKLPTKEKQDITQD